ncbi:hypothetical protein B0H12DRAFT_1147445 [Mycena haematopus]|nr:hypothetical protein B0H12DRAFT_1147445 [Mycena haematopus]
MRRRTRLRYATSRENRTFSVCSFCGGVNQIRTEDRHFLSVPAQRQRQPTNPAVVRTRHRCVHPSPLAMGRHY